MKTKSPLHCIDRLLAVLAAIFALCHAPQAKAQTNLVTWGLNGTTNQTSVETSSVATGIVASSLSQGAGVNNASLGNAINGTNWTQTSQAAAFDADKYFEFTIAPEANYVLTFSSLNANLRRSNTGPADAAWVYSLDDYDSNLASTNAVSTGANGANLAVSLSDTNITQAVTFRLTAWGASAAGGTFGIRATNTGANPTLNGTATLRSAASLVWDGGRGSGSWTAYNATNANQANWGGNNTPLNGDTLVFAGTAQTNTTNTVTSLLANAIVFSNTAGTFAISGNALTVSNGITNLSASAQVFSNQVTLGAAQAFNASAGSLSFAGNVVNAGNALTVAGSADTLISGALSGSGDLSKTDTGTLTLAGNNNSFNGGTTVTGGSVVAANNNALGSGAVAMNNGSVVVQSGISIGNNVVIGFRPVENYYSQNFNDIGSGLPTGWTVRTGATASTLGSAESFDTAATSWGDGAGRFKNFASATGLTANASTADQAASTDRALGIRQSGTFGDPGASFNYSFSTIGETIESISLDLMMLSVQERSTTWSIQYGLGADPSSFVTLGTWADPGTFGTTPLTLTGFGTALDNQASVFLRIVALSVTTSSGTRDSMAIDNFVIRNFGAIGTGTLGISEAGTATLSGNVEVNSTGIFTAAENGHASFSGIVSGQGSVAKTGVGTVTLSGNNTFSGGTTLSEGILRLTSAMAAGTGTITQTSGASTLVVDTDATIANSMSVYNVAFLQGATLSGAVTVNNATFDVAESETSTISGVIDGSAGVTKTGLGQLTLTGQNTYTGATAVNAGVLELASSTGGAAGATSAVSVASGATLLISASNQVNDSAAVTLSGGTITRGSGVSEVFGNLNLTVASFLDFGTGATGTLGFGTYETPSSLLTVQNFFEGNVVTFGSNLTGSINNESLFSFDNAFTSNWDGSTFTITAIPEPSTYAAAAGLIGLMLWPSRRRLLRDAKKILGFTPPMRDRLAARSRA